jgi:hypothetical protein
MVAVLGCIPWRSAGKREGDSSFRFFPRFLSSLTVRIPPWMTTGGHALNMAVLMSIFILSIMHIAVGTYNPFIYFRF